VIANRIKQQLHKQPKSLEKIRQNFSFNELQIYAKFRGAPKKNLTSSSFKQIYLYIYVSFDHSRKTKNVSN